MTPGRVVGRAAAAALLAACLTALAAMSIASPARADPTPTPPVAPSSPAAPAAPASPSPPAGQPAGQDQSQPGEGVLAPLTDTQAGKVPLSRYEITADPGAWNQWDRKLLIFATNGVFALVKVIIGAVVWLLDWGFQFGPAKVLLGPASDVAATYKTHVVDRLGLPGFLLTLAGVWCGLLILRGRNARGWGELGISLLISAVAATLLANPAGLLMGDQGVVGKTRDTAMALASITATRGASADETPGKAAAPLTKVVLDTFIAQPYQMLQFGQLIDDPQVPAACKKAYIDGLTKTPPGFTFGDLKPGGARMQADRIEDGPGYFMEKPKGCEKLARYHHDPTWDRLLGAVLLLVAALLVAVLILIAVGVLLMAICGLAFYAMTGNAVAVIAILPGGSRGLLWRWLAGIAKVVLLICAIVVVIPLLALFISALMRAATGQALIVKFFLMDVACAAALVYHRKLIQFSTRAGHRIARRMEMARYGGSRGTGSQGYGGGPGGYGGYGYGGMGMGWLGAGDPNAISPVSLSGGYRGVRAEIGRVTAPAAMARHAWMGDPAAGAKARRELGAGAGEFQQKMYGSRGGRALWRTAKAARVGTAYTLGAPVAWPRAAQHDSPQRERVRQLRERLGNAAAARGQGAVGYGREWTRNTARATGLPLLVRTAAHNPQIRELVGQDVEAARRAASAAGAAWTIRRGAAETAREHGRDGVGPAPPPAAERTLADQPGGQAAAELRRHMDQIRWNRAGRPPTPPEGDD